MFPGSNTNADLGYNKHNQYMAQPPHFLGGPNSGNVPGPGVGNTVRSAVPVMPLNMQGSIDWAQLAQQWIHMRDSTAAPPLANFSMNPPIAPPPPIISNAPEYQTQPELRHQQSKALTHFEEHGEAEMDMDEEENESNVRAIPDIKNVPPPPVATQAQWLDSSAPITVAPIDAAGSCAQPWSNWPARVHPTAHIPSLLKLNVCNPNETQHLMQPIQQPQQNNNNGGNVASSEIDANKRKMLPAWIREGLEKMEREKQRQLERQQCTTPEDDSSAINVKQVSSKTLTTPVNLLNISNMASDSEDSIAAPEEAAQAISMAHLIGNDVLNKTSGSDEEQDTEMDKRQQQSQHQYAVDGQKPTIARAANAEAALSGKNYEERLADLMLVVRRTLTEILLETTNEEIAAIATETVKAHRAKASSAQVIRKSALSSITGKLGLAAYGDSSSESGEDDNSDNNDGSQVEHNFDSTTKSTELTADELKTRIRKSKRAFEKVIDDIEERVSLQEQVDEQKLQHHRKLELERTKTATEQRSESPTDAIPSTTMTSGLKTSEKSQFNGKRHSRKERTTRFSDNKDSKQSQSYVSQVVAVTSAAQNSVLPPKLKPVPNPATNLLQMPDSMATMLNAADKALDKAQKTSKKTKARRRQSSSSSSSSSSSDSSSSSSSSDSNSTSNSSKSSSHTDGSSTRSSLATKKRSSTSNRRSRGRSSRKQRSETSRERHRKGHSSSSRHSYNRHHSSRERDRDRHALHYSSQRNERRRRHQQRDSSNSGDEDGSDYRRSSRHSSSRSHQSNSYGKHRDKTRSRSNSRSTHNSYSSASTSHQQRKRH